MAASHVIEVMEPRVLLTSFVNFEEPGFAVGESVQAHRPDGTDAAPPVDGINPEVQAFSVRDGSDEEIVDISGTDPQHGKVWRISDQVARGNLQKRAHVPHAGTLEAGGSKTFAGETGAIDDFGLETPTTDTLYFEIEFKSATGTAQTGMEFDIYQAVGDDGRHGFVRLIDDGTGFDLLFIEGGDNSAKPSPLAFNFTALDLNLSYSDWHTIGIETKFVDGFATGTAGAAGNDVVKVFVNGDEVHRGTSWETVYFAVGSGDPRGVDRGSISPNTTGLSDVDGGIYVDNIFLSDVRPQPFTLAFDFGKSDSPVAVDTQQVTAQTAFAPGSFGWTSQPAGAKDNRDRADALLRDYHQIDTSRVFRAAVPDGLYSATILVGSTSTAVNDAGFSFEGVFADNVSVARGGSVERTFTGIQVTDGVFDMTVTKNGSTSAIINGLRIVAARSAPVVDGTASPLVFNEGDPDVAVDGGILVTDSNSPNLVGGTVSIRSGFVSGEDELKFTNQNGITGVFNSTTGVLTLTGAASVANYQTALRSVQYSNTAAPVTDSQRVVRFSVSDGVDSGFFDRTIDVNGLTSVALDFDFGKATTPVAPGSTGVSLSDSYAQPPGFGVISTTGTALAKERRDVADPRLTDYIGVSGSVGSSLLFAADLPNGAYDITIIMGTTSNSLDQVEIDLEGSNVDSVSAARGEFVTRVFNSVIVTGGRLELEIRVGGTSPAIINSLVVTDS